jgi:hypothetical protein
LRRENALLLLAKTEATPIRPVGARQEVLGLLLPLLLVLLLVLLVLLLSH